MFRSSLMFTCLALAACATVPTTPQRADLNNEMLRVDFGRGFQCKGPKTAETATQTGWSGRLQGCAQAYDYEVILEDGNNPVRYVLVEGFAALGADDLFAPLAVVRVSRPDGQMVEFISPPKVKTSGHP